MESLVTKANLILGLIAIVSAGGLHLDFGVNLPPFVLHMPRFNLPPIKIAATFKPTSSGGAPFAIKFPGISIATNQGQQQDSWWNQNQAWPEPEPEPEVEPYPDSEPKPEPEPESEPEPEPEYHHNHHSYDPWGKSSIKSVHHKDSWASRARTSNGASNNKMTQHVYMKPQSTHSKSSVLTNGQQLNRQRSIVNAQMSAIRGSSPSQSSASVIDKSPPTAAQVDSWLSQMKSINTINTDQYELSSNPIDYDRRRSSNAHITRPYSPPINPKSAKIDQSSTATIEISNGNNLLQPGNHRVNQQQSNN